MIHKIGAIWLSQGLQAAHAELLARLCSGAAIHGTGRADPPQDDNHHK